MKAVKQILKDGLYVKIVDNYILLQEIARGTYSIVYDAIRYDGYKCVIKVLRREGYNTSEYRISKYINRHIVDITPICVSLLYSNKRTHIVYPKYRMTLSCAVARNLIKDKKSIYRRLLFIVYILKRLSIRHGDISRSNIMFVDEIDACNLRIIDFGLSSFKHNHRVFGTIDDISALGYLFIFIELGYAIMEKNRLFDVSNYIKLQKFFGYTPNQIKIMVNKIYKRKGNIVDYVYNHCSDDDNIKNHIKDNIFLDLICRMIGVYPYRKYTDVRKIMKHRYFHR